MASNLRNGLLRSQSGPPDPDSCETCRLLWKTLDGNNSKDYGLGVGAAYVALAQHIENSHAEYISAWGEE